MYGWMSSSAASSLMRSAKEGGSSSVSVGALIRIRGMLLPEEAEVMVEVGGKGTLNSGAYCDAEVEEAAEAADLFIMVSFNFFTQFGWCLDNTSISLDFSASNFVISILRALF